jgi:hypothetical protein
LITEYYAKFRAVFLSFCGLFSDKKSSPGIALAWESAEGSDCKFLPWIGFYSLHVPPGYDTSKTVSTAEFNPIIA